MGKCQLLKSVVVWAGIAQLVCASIQVGRSGDRIPVEGETFLPGPDRPWGHPSPLHNEHRVYTGDKATGAWRRLPTPI
jgi:hypothetical protein